MGDVAVSVEGLGKRYRIAHQQARYGRLTESLAGIIRTPMDRMRGRPREEGEWFWALKGVSFEVNAGEVMGIIGRNGAGKSTLLKIVSRITEPTEGRAELSGRVASLLEVGTGFHPELTGRENIFLSGSVLGMRKVDIQRRFDEIVDFAEVERFLDTPVKRYSSGMQVRLGFAVAAHLEPEILVVDEVLAVGDAEFQRKCLGRMGDVSHEGRTVLFVSHNLSAVTALCSRALLLDSGSVVEGGPVHDVVKTYAERFVRDASDDTGAMTFARDDTLTAQIDSVSMLSPSGVTASVHELLDPIEVVIEFTVREDLPSLIVACEVHSSSGEYVFVTVSADWDNHRSERMLDRFPTESGQYRATVRIPSPLLNEGAYELVVYLARGGDNLDRRDAIYFEVKDAGSFASVLYKQRRGGTVVVPMPWSVARTSSSSRQDEPR